MMNSENGVVLAGKNRWLARPRSVAALLWALTALFTVRVLGQAVQRWWPQSFLPPFNSFQGSGLPYPLLLTAQIVILGLMRRTALRVRAGTLRPSPAQLKALAWFAFVYMGGSMLRIVIGILVPAAPAWFTTWIPAFFHLVLAAFVTALALHISYGMPNSASDRGVSS
jgi:hypothetical protein